MPKLDDLVAVRAKSEIQVGDMTVSFTYYPVVRKRFSEDEWQRLMAQRGRDYLRELLPRVVPTWDISTDDGPIPVTAEAFDQYDIPDVILQAIERRIFNSDLAGKAI